MVYVWRVKTFYSFVFEKVAADRVTGSSVFINGSRSARISEGTRYFDTFDAAKESAMLYLTQRRERLRRELDECEERLITVEKTTDETCVLSTSKW